MKKTILFLLLAAVCLGTMAEPMERRRRGRRAKKVEEVKPDTIPVDTFSYLIGNLNTRGLMQYLSQQMGVDVRYIDDFLQGFQADSLSEADLRAKARIAGTELRQDVEARVIPSVSKQMNDSVDLLNHQLFLLGFQDGIQGKVPAIGADSAIKVVDKQMQYYREQIMEKKYGPNRRAGEEFLLANKENDSVQVTASGLQYKIITQGTGAVPTKEQKVKVHYEGRLIDGTVFDSSYMRGQPATFGVTQVIPGWIEALTMMPVGSKWEVYIPQQLAYGAREQRTIPAFSCLVFTVELLEIVQ